MGGEIDITANTWGALMGGNFGEWSNQNNLGFDVSGISLQSTLGDSIVFPDRGWGWKYLVSWKLVRLTKQM